MCRIAAYLGKPLLLKDFLIEPEHSLYVQSWAPAELHYAKLNADGFGIGWYQDDGSPAAYRNAAPVWSDPNLAGLAAILNRGLWMAMVRSATPGYANSVHNTQPFHGDGRLFLHNGFITNFQYELRRALLNALEPQIEADIAGLTDSEYLFALMRQLMRNTPDKDGAEILRDARDWLQARMDGHSAMLNFVISEPGALFALRAAIGEAAPTLYYLYEDSAHWIASERLTPAKPWQAVPENSILTAKHNTPPRIIEL